jgi:cell division protein FtsW
MCIIANIPLVSLQKLTPLAFIAGLGCMALPFFAPSYARVVHGSARWITIMGTSLQPIEFVRIAYIPTVAFLISTATFIQYSFLYRILFIGLATGPLILLLLLQPDFGQAVLCTTASLLMFTLVQNNLRPMIMLFAAACSSALALVIYKPYRLQRLLTFLYPWKDPQGAGFQVIQSFIAIGSGGVGGLGIGQSRQKFFYLPMQHTDFIFSIIAEETGFIGSVILIILYGIFLYCGMYLAWHAKSLFTQLTLFGYTLTTSLQALINLAVATGLAPTKGIGLPFVSYGMSSIIAHGCMLGVIIACVRGEKYSTLTLKQPGSIS